VDITFVTVGGTALPGSDFVEKTGKVSIKAGDTTKRLSFRVNGDKLREPAETFYIDILNVTNAVAVRTRAVVKILASD
jgi:hypothetical protein